MNEDQKKALSAIGTLNMLMRENLSPDSPSAVPIIRAAIEAEEYLKYQHFWVKLFHNPKQLTQKQYEIVSMNVQASAILEAFVSYVDEFRKIQSISGA